MIVGLGAELRKELGQRKGLDAGLVLVVKSGTEHDERNFRTDFCKILGAEVGQRLRTVRQALGHRLRLAHVYTCGSICVIPKQTYIFFTGYPIITIISIRCTWSTVSRTLGVLVCVVLLTVGSDWGIGHNPS